MLFLVLLFLVIYSVVFFFYLSLSLLFRFLRISDVRTWMFDWKSKEKPNWWSLFRCSFVVCSILGDQCSNIPLICCFMRSMMNAIGNILYWHRNALPSPYLAAATIHHTNRFGQKRAHERGFVRLRSCAHGRLATLWCQCLLCALIPFFSL